jgi:ribulose-phosphate 3-epimerase
VYVSVISQSPRRFFEQISELLNAGIDGFHVDIMDGDFVPRLGLYPEFINELREITDLPIEAHVMTQRPERTINYLIDCGVTSIVPHFEAMQNPSGVLREISARELESGIAINPGTPIENLKWLLREINSITVMGINPGIKGHQLIESTPQKVNKLLEYFRTQPTFAIEVDGGVTFENIDRLVSAGASRLVCGAGTVFAPQNGVSTNLQKVREEIEKSVRNTTN